MKKTLLAIALVALLSAPAVAQIAGTAHDLSTFTNTTEVCVFCHTPHDSLVQAPRATNQYPLWNHQLSVAGPFLVYDSVTMEQHPPSAGYDDFNGNDNTSTALCMSCHDGTVAVNLLQNGPGPGDVDPTLTGNSPGGGVDQADGLLDNGPAFLDVDLTNDHPVNLDYATSFATDTELVAAAGGLTLFGGRIQCATCHDPHDDTNGMFLVVSNAGSALCTTCHVK